MPGSRSHAPFTTLKLRSTSKGRRKTLPHLALLAAQRRKQCRRGRGKGRSPNRAERRAAPSRPPWQSGRLNAARFDVPSGDRPDLPAFSGASLGEGLTPYFKPLLIAFSNVAWLSSPLNSQKKAPPRPLFLA